MDLGMAIRVGLAIKNKSKSWLAGELGVSKQYIGQLCKNAKTPSLEMITDISTLFNVTEAEFIGWGDL